MTPPWLDKAEVFRFRDRLDYATFMVYEDPSKNYYALAIESSFGGFSYAWSQPGCPFNQFLARIGLDYLTSKLVGYDEVFDGEGSAKAVRAEIISLRRSGEIDKDQARDAWPDSDFSSESDFHWWSARQDLFKADPPEMLFWRTCGGRRTRELEGLYKRFWPMFKEALLTGNEACGSLGST